MVLHNVGVPTTTYLFIDGGYLRERYREKMTNFFGVEAELDFAAILRSVNAKRAFYLRLLSRHSKKWRVRTGS
jgi:hypothetical protein